MSFSNDARESNFRTLSNVLVGTTPINKLDLIAVVSFHGSIYFNVFRRYNSVYEIVIEDFNGDVFVHKDYTIRQSMQQMLCLSNEEMQGMFTMQVLSFKHNAPPPMFCSMDVIADMRWSKIQQEWLGLAINFGGVLNNYYETASAYANEHANEYANVDANMDASANEHANEYANVDANEYATESATEYNPITLSSDEFRSIVKDVAKSLLSELEAHKRTWSMMKEEEEEGEEEEEEGEEEEEEEEGEDEEEKEEKSTKRENCMYTILRNGTRIFKGF